MPIKLKPLNILMGKRLTRIREGIQEDLSKREFAKMLGVDESRLTKWESGKNAVSDEARVLLRNRWGVSMEYFISDDPKRLEPEFFPMPKTKAG